MQVEGFVDGLVRKEFTLADEFCDAPLTVRAPPGHRRRVISAIVLYDRVDQLASSVRGASPPHTPVSMTTSLAGGELVPSMLLATPPFVFTSAVRMSVLVTSLPAVLLESSAV